MDFLELDDRITKLLASARYDAAEQELRRARATASEEGDNYALERVLSSFVNLYCIMEPPDLKKAESYSSELERVSGRAAAKAQTAMMLYWSMHNPIRTVAKCEEAIESATVQHDEMTLYQCLSLMGLALLDLRRMEEAAQTLQRIEQMVQSRSKIVVGDETLFLERFSSVTTELSITTKIQGIATILWPVCQDEAFANRLKALATS